MAANNIVKFFQKVLVVYQIASVVCHYQLRMSTLESRTSFMDQEVSLKVTKRKWFMHIKLLLYLKTKQLVWSTSVHDIILGGRNVLHGSRRFLIANIKCKTFFFKTDGCCTQLLFSKVWAIVYELLLYFIVNQFVWSLSIQDVIFDVRNFLHGLGSFLLNDKK